MDLKLIHLSSKRGPNQGLRTRREPVISVRTVLKFTHSNDSHSICSYKLTHRYESYGIYIFKLTVITRIVYIVLCSKAERNKSGMMKNVTDLA